MRGIPGSGKSTKAGTLTDSENIYSTDDYWGPNYEFDISKIGMAHRWNQHRVSEAMIAEKPIIVVDNTNITWKEVDPYVVAAMRKGYDVEFVEPTSQWWHDFIEAKNKVDKNLLELAEHAFHVKNTHNVPLFVIQKMMIRWQPTKQFIERYKEELKKYEKLRNIS